MADILNENRINVLRYGIMCNDYSFKSWQANAIKAIEETGNFKLELLIFNSGNNKSILHSQFSILNYPYKNLVWRIYKRFFYKPVSENIFDMSEELRNIPGINCITEKKGKFSDYFQKKDIDIISSYKLDFIIRFGFNIIRGDILNSAKFGIWSYHHDDELKYRGGPPGFWEIYKNDNVNSVVLQKLTDKLDAGIILKKGYFKTVKHSYSANIDNIYFGAAAWIKQVAMNIQKSSNNDQQFKFSETKAEVYTYPNNFQMLIFLWTLFYNKIKFHFNELFKAEQWNIGIINKPINSLLKDEKPEIIWLPKQKRNLFRADPFGYMDNNELKIFFEDYNYKTRKGNISNYNFKNSELSIVNLAKRSHELKTDKFFVSNCQLSITQNFHLAYPYIFSVDKDIYCLPESSEAKKIDLYKIDKSSGSLTFMKTLIDNIDAIDSTIFQYNGLWWLFFTRKQFDSNTNLFVYYSEKFDGEYKPHFNNPVKTDISSARSAGTPFLVETLHATSLYRPSQDSSSTYGGSVKINRVTKLSPYEFEEETVKIIKPDNESLYNSGIHTISSAGNNTIVDGKRMIFIWESFIYQLIRKARKISGFKSNN